MLFLKVDPRIVDTLVAHAMSVPVAAHAAEEVKADGAKIKDADFQDDVVENGNESDEDA